MADPGQQQPQGAEDAVRMKRTRRKRGKGSKQQITQDPGPSRNESNVPRRLAVRAPTTDDSMFSSHQSSAAESAPSFLLALPFELLERCLSVCQCPPMDADAAELLCFSRPSPQRLT
jgi:hypothetical protein